jgi:hypothetical protein
MTHERERMSVSCHHQRLIEPPVEPWNSPRAFPDIRKAGDDSSWHFTRLHQLELLDPTNARSCAGY